MYLESPMHIVEVTVEPYILTFDDITYKIFQRFKKPLHLKISSHFTGAIKKYLGYPSDYHLDHLNQDPKDWRMCNLQPKTALENQQNRSHGRKDSYSYGATIHYRYLG